MKAILFGLVVIGILILVGCRAMTVQPDAPRVIDDAGYGRYATPAPAGFHPFADGDNGSWL
ncbi:MAG: hypothetical protein JO203_04300 [Gammaproteobacteria bacterium]|nr:hypothetical protein [Alphaproteobacteria bacterium]MBV8403391.1 hypothetical protein [Gammaproteobacteria bacterium]